MGLLYEEYYTQKRGWEETRDELEEKVKRAGDAVEAGKAKLAEYESAVEVLKTSQGTGEKDELR